MDSITLLTAAGQVTAHLREALLRGELSGTVGPVVGNSDVKNALLNHPSYCIHVHMTKGVAIDPAVCHGKPVIEGTRVLVATVLGALAGGDSQKDVAEDYDITLGQISDALQFASDMANMQVSAYDAVA